MCKYKEEFAIHVLCLFLYSNNFSAKSAEINWHKKKLSFFFFGFSLHDERS